MRKITSTLLFLLLGATAFCQTEKDRSMVPIMDDCKSLITDIENRNEEIVRMEFDIVSTEKETFRTLTDAYTYGITVVGDYRISKIGIELYTEGADGYWKLVKKENADKHYTSIVIKPAVTQRYRIVVKALSFEQGYTIGRYGLLIYHE